MIKAMVVVAFVALCVALCIAVTQIVATFGLMPALPAYGGDEDFDLRLTYFLSVACSGFAALGVWVGMIFLQSRQRALAMLAGIILGSALTFVLVRLVLGDVAPAASGSMPNRLVLGMFVAWVAVSALSARIAQVVSDRRT